MVLPVTLKNRTIENMWRTATKSATALPSNTNDDLFTISSGNVQILMLLGECTVATDSTVADLKFRFTPSGGSAEDISGDFALSSAITAAELLLWQGAGVSPTAGFFVEGPDFGRGTIFGPGTIRVDVSAAITVGTIQWYCSWIPVDVGAGVIGV